MLDEKDLEMIAKTIRESNEPILEEMKKLAVETGIISSVAP